MCEDPHPKGTHTQIQSEESDLPKGTIGGIERIRGLTGRIGVDHVKMRGIKWNYLTLEKHFDQI
jgi:hypothetical protein